MLTIPSALKTLLDFLLEHGANPIFVGGYVRDALLQVESKDIDIEVYGVSSLSALSALLENFGSVNSVGKSFGVLKLSLDTLEIDFSLPRTDSKVDSGHRGFEITTNANLSFTQAAKRRDFTINALGYEYKTSTLLDPYGGQTDLKNRILKEVDDKHFAEDPLRIYRAMQFCARFELRMSDSLSALCSEMVTNQQLDELPQERIFEEYKKLLLKSQHPSIGIKLLAKFSLLDFHPSSLVLDALDRLAQNRQHQQTLTLMFSALLFEHTNPIAFLNHLTRDKKFIDSILLLINTVHELHHYSKIDNYLTYKLSTKIEINHLLELSYALNINITLLDSLSKHATKLKVTHSAPEPLIQGRDLIALGLKPSKSFKEILETCYDAQLQELFDDHSSALDYAQKCIITLKKEEK